MSVTREPRRTGETAYRTGAATGIAANADLGSAANTPTTSLDDCTGTFTDNDTIAEPATGPGDGTETPNTPGATV